MVRLPRPALISLQQFTCRYQRWATSQWPQRQAMRFALAAAALYDATATKYAPDVRVLAQLSVTSAVASFHRAHPRNETKTPSS